MQVVTAERNSGVQLSSEKWLQKNATEDMKVLVADLKLWIGSRSVALKNISYLFSVFFLSNLFFREHLRLNFMTKHFVEHFLEELLRYRVASIFFSQIDEHLGASPDTKWWCDRRSTKCLCTLAFIIHSRTTSTAGDRPAVVCAIHLDLALNSPVYGSQFWQLRLRTSNVSF